MGNHQKHIKVQLSKLSLHRIHRFSRVVSVVDSLSINKIRHDNTRLIHHSHLLSCILREHHNHTRKNAHRRKKHRHDESCQKERLLLYTSQILARNDYTYISKFHSLFLRNKFNEYIVHPRNKFLE